MFTPIDRVDYSTPKIDLLVAEIVSAVREGDDGEISRLDALLRAEEGRIALDPTRGRNRAD